MRTHYRPGIDPRPEGWASDTDPNFTDEQLALREAQREATCIGVPIWQLEGTEEMVYCTSWDGVPSINGVPYRVFIGRYTVEEAVEMGAREYQ